MDISLESLSLDTLITLYHSDDLPPKAIEWIDENCIEPALNKKPQTIELVKYLIRAISAQKDPQKHYSLIKDWLTSNGSKIMMCLTSDETDKFCKEFPAEMSGFSVSSLYGNPKITSKLYKMGMVKDLTMKKLFLKLADDAPKKRHEDLQVYISETPEIVVRCFNDFWRDPLPKTNLAYLMEVDLPIEALPDDSATDDALLRLFEVIASQHGVSHKNAYGLGEIFGKPGDLSDRVYRLLDRNRKEGRPLYGRWRDFECPLFGQKLYCRLMNTTSIAHLFGTHEGYFVGASFLKGAHAAGAPAPQTYFDATPIRPKINIPFYDYGDGFDNHFWTFIISTSGVQEKKISNTAEAFSLWQDSFDDRFSEYLTHLKKSIGDDTEAYQRAKLSIELALLNKEASSTRDIPKRNRKTI